MIKEKVNLSFRFKSRVNDVDPEMLALAKKAGCHLVSYGMESGVGSQLDRISKGTTVEENAAACGITKAAGLLCHAGFVLGYPGETPESLEQTLKFIIDVKPTTVSISPLVPYPGTKVYEEAKSNGSLRGDWSLNCGFQPWVKLPWLGNYEELVSIARRMRNKIYYRPFYAKVIGVQALKDLKGILARYFFQESVKALAQLRGKRRVKL